MGKLYFPQCLLVAFHGANVENNSVRLFILYGVGCGQDALYHLAFRDIGAAAVAFDEDICHTNRKWRVVLKGNGEL